MMGQEEKKRPAALNLTSARPATSNSASSPEPSLKAPRTPRFAEATSIHSPVDGKNPFSTTVTVTETSQFAQVQPGDVGFGYIHNEKRESVMVPMTPRSPLKSAMKVPGTPGRFLNPLSPTFHEETVLEKREALTDVEQARDVKIKTRVRMAKFALRGVNFSCSLIVLGMLSSSFAIFNATKEIPQQSMMPAWASGTNPWAQKVVLSMACLSLFATILVFIGYCRGGHKRAEKVNTYYTMFAIGWFMVSLVLWVVSAVVFQNAKNNSKNKDMWGWACAQNTRSVDYQNKVDYQLICRLQSWTLICIIIEIVVEVLAISLYSIMFYRYYTKRRLHKTMDMRDRARSDLYLAQLRTQSAPNTPGFGPKSPAFSQYAMSPRHPPAAFRSFGGIREESPFTPGGIRVLEPQSQFAKPVQPAFKLQAPPSKAPSATPKIGSMPSPIDSIAQRAPSPPGQTLQEEAPRAMEEPVYDAVPIPGAYADQAIKSPPPTTVSFGHAQ